MEETTLQDARLAAAKAKLLAEAHTCALCTAAGAWHTASAHGIRPPLQWLRAAPALLGGATVADRVVGLAAAMLYAHGGIRAIWAQTMSEPALAFLEAQGIVAAHDRLVPEIRNQAGDGLCPMEQKAMQCATAAQAFALFDAMLPKA
ncbi:MAG: DUF1893 domain-containing protein [Oscillospiraceae bacterium]|jgi:hypothetical protein|nr:DUF1893 domain-containing protein [Oscillospiraceae bacterium]